MTKVEPLVDEAPGRGRAAAPAPVNGRGGLPTARLIVDDRGEAVAVDAAWATLTGQQSPDALGRGWQRALDPAHRGTVVERMREGRVVDHVDCPVLTRRGRRWMRLWWGAAEGDVLEVTMVDVDDLWQQAAHDPLTGLVNRRELLVQIDAALRSSRLTGELPHLLFVDLDGIEAVNDAHGHRAGDRLLAEVATHLAAAVRPSDAVGRVGGDAFAVLCGPPCDPAVASVLAGRIERSVEAVGIGSAHALSAVTGSVRASPADTGETLLARADTAMHASRAAQARASRATAWQPGDDEAIVDLATTVVQRLFGVGLTLHAASSIADAETKPRIQAAVDDLDRLINDLRLSVFTTIPSVSVATDDAPARAIDTLREAIGAAAQELHDEWVVSVDPLAPGGQRERLARAAMHVRAAARAIDPGTLG